MNSTVDRQKELNERVATLLGWKLQGKTWIQPIRDHYLEHFEVPDYCNDLNACADFEKLLDTEEQQRDTSKSWFKFLGMKHGRLRMLQKRWSQPHSNAQRLS